MNHLDISLIPLDYFSVARVDGNDIPVPTPAMVFSARLNEQQGTVELFGATYYLQDLFRLADAWYQIGYQGHIYYNEHIMCRPEGLYINSLKFFNNWDDFKSWIIRLTVICKREKEGK
jgi:hypothetical protein